ncbi:MAG: hypothetical protein AMXMBFR58_29290 [Phycisphaerae bacterium]
MAKEPVAPLHWTLGGNHDETTMLMEQLEARCDPLEQSGNGMFNRLFQTRHEGPRSRDIKVARSVGDGVGKAMD